MAEIGSGCEDENCSLASGFLHKCSNQECHWEEPVFGMIVCVTIIYIPLMLFGLLGNILTILVVWLRPYMRSSTYLYLSSLAVSDILILLLLPVDLYKLWRPRPWPFGEIFCKSTMFFSECCTFCSILHITFISLERYLAVCWPFTAKTVVTRRRTRTIIGCIWLGAAISAAPVWVMVGVEEVQSEDQGLSGWRESGAWTGKEGEKGFIIGERERENRDKGLKDEQLEEMNWKDKEMNECGDKNGVTKGFKGGDKSLEVGEGTKEQEHGERAAEGEEAQNKMKEDEGGGGGEGDTDGGGRMQVDTRECRCTDYAVSSGLLSAMLVLSNMYFLVPLCILGLVYGLIGRTLWLRSQISRRDVNNRNTVKMLGVIVLVFVLCWLPFHVGRTIFFFSLGSDRPGVNASHALLDSRVPLELPPPGALGESDEAAGDAFSEAQTGRGDGGRAVLDTRGTEARSDGEAAGPSTPEATTADPYDAENSTPLDDTHSHSQYFLYYLSQYFNLVSSVLFYLSAAINPLLYNLMSERYRHAVHSLLPRRAGTRARRLQTLTAVHSITTTTM
uniref:Orphan G protein-coupled receptor n=1 Tax=Sphoeroides nephelus TaxID=39110 RepID=O93414_9TELE|nr:orphan G protein-coupled receptor [Sphoeroides nephelus]